MTTKELMGKCQEYYGMQYSIGMGGVIIRYLDTLEDRVKPYLFAETVKTHSASFKSLPDVSTFESCIGMAWEDYNEDHKTYLRLELPDPSEVFASRSEIEEFSKWLHSQTWKSSEFKKVKDWKREDRL